MIKNPSSVPAFLSLKDPEGSPCPITLKDTFWVDALRKLAMEGMDLQAYVKRMNKVNAIQKARDAQQKKKQAEYAALQEKRKKEAAILADKINEQAEAPTA